MFAGTCALLTTVGGTVYGIASLAGEESGTVRAEPAAPPGTASGASRPALPGSSAPPSGEDPNSGASGGDVGGGMRIGDDLARGTAAETRLLEADRTPSRPPRDSAPAAGVGTPAGQAAPVIPQLFTVRTVTESRIIPFRTRVVRDRSLPRGRVRERRPGIPGLRSIRYRVTYVAGRETFRVLLGAAVTRTPQDRVIAVGSRKRRGGGKGHHDCRAKADRCTPKPPATPPSCANAGNQPGDPVNSQPPTTPATSEPPPGATQNPPQPGGSPDPAQPSASPDPAQPGGTPVPGGVSPTPAPPAGGTLPGPVNGIPAGGLPTVTQPVGPGTDPAAGLGPVPVLIVPAPRQPAPPTTCD
ncbi:G5 domain-containing protein [Krasilnikovia sp. M28-CT-15]|uniref:G5 domain-containing protein n=1 Tax=Krasilnikovia sp. M28-CT-15 TaxID=3373540 RepID=UPI00399CC22C